MVANFVISFILGTLELDARATSPKADMGVNRGAKHFVRFFIVYCCSILGFLWTLGLVSGKQFLELLICLLVQIVEQRFFPIIKNDLMTSEARKRVICVLTDLPRNAVIRMVSAT